MAVADSMANTMSEQSTDGMRMNEEQVKEFKRILREFFENFDKQWKLSIKTGLKCYTIVRMDKNIGRVWIDDDVTGSGSIFDDIVINHQSAKFWKYDALVFAVSFNEVESYEVEIQ